ncbi:MAG: DUF4097 domain-containing protein [Prevotellaceae bacterium]|jgi:hypothetical protein|nr:DUF4097 domain-containing protein [Prevotellaceae bacterium]
MNAKIKLAAIAVLVALFTQHPAAAREHRAEKTIVKSFDARAGHDLAIDHKFGNVNIVNWDRNEVYFSIEIEVESDSESKTREKLSKIDVVFSQSGKRIEARTVFEQYDCNNCNIKITYNVSVPRGINLKLQCQYGNVKIPNIEGTAEINLKYGNLNGESLGGNSNDLNVNYGNIKLSGDITGASNINIKYGNFEAENLPDEQSVFDIAYGNASFKKTGKARFSVKYSNVKLTEVKEMEIESAYSKFKADKAGSIRASAKYDKYSIGAADRIKGSLSYVDLQVGNLNESLTVEQVKYGHVNVNKVARNFESIRIDAAYTNIHLGFDRNASFSSDMHTSYGSINVDSAFGTKTKKDKDEYLQTNSGKAAVKIENKHADITIATQ